MSNPDSASRAERVCPNLRNKEMFYQAPGQAEDQFSSGLYWCTRTCEIFGPDGQPVGRAECQQQRKCFGS